MFSAIQPYNPTRDKNLLYYLRMQRRPIDHIIDEVLNDRPYALESFVHFERRGLDQAALQHWGLAHRKQKNLPGPYLVVLGFYYLIIEQNAGLASAYFEEAIKQHHHGGWVGKAAVLLAEDKYAEAQLFLMELLQSRFYRSLNEFNMHFHFFPVKKMFASAENSFNAAAEKYDKAPVIRQDIQSMLNYQLACAYEGLAQVHKQSQNYYDSMICKDKVYGCLQKGLAQDSTLVLHKLGANAATRINQDKPLAFSYYCGSMQEGDAFSLANLSDFYKKGIVVEKNVGQAATYLRLANFITDTRKWLHHLFDLVIQESKPFDHPDNVSVIYHAAIVCGDPSMITALEESVSQHPEWVERLMEWDVKLGVAKKELSANLNFNVNADWQNTVNISFNKNNDHEFKFSGKPDEGILSRRSVKI